MKKINYLLSLIVLYTLGIYTASAGVLHQQLEQLTEVNVGDTIAIKGAVNSNASGVQKFFAGESLSSYIEDEGIYIVEDAGIVDGLQAYYLKNYKLNAYVSYDYPFDEMSQGVVTYSEEKDKAASFWIGKPDTLAANENSRFYMVIDESKSYHEFDMESSLLITYTLDVSALGNFNYWCFTNGFAGNNPSFYGQYNCRASNIYRTTAVESGELTLQSILLEYPEGVSDLYVVGTNPGCVSQEVVDDVIAKYAAAIETLDSGADNETMLAAYHALTKALEDASAARIPITEGYYAFEGAAGKTVKRGVMYTDDTIALWEELPTDSAIVEPKFIWHVTARANDEGLPLFDMQNYLTGLYMAGTTTGTSTNLPVVAEPTENAMLIEPGNEDKFVISSTLPANNVNYAYFHCQGHTTASGSLVLWTKAAPASNWYVRPIPDDIIDGLRLPAEFEKAKINLENIYNKSAGKLLLSRQYILPEGVEANLDYSNMGLITTEDQLWSNADMNKIDGASAGLGIAALVNGVAGQTAAEKDWFHTSWTGTVINEPHNLSMNLKEKVSCVGFKLSPRKPNSAASLTSALLYACNDTTGNDKWVEVATIPEIFKATSDTVCIIPGVDLGGEYQYLRLVCTGTLNGKKYGGQIFFNLAEFHAYKSTYDPTTSQFETISNAQKFKTLIEECKALLENAEVTQDYVNQFNAKAAELQAEYDIFISELADYSLFEDKVKEGKFVVENAVVGEEPGNVPDGATAELDGSIDAISATITALSSKSEMEAAMAQIDDAIALFLTKVVKVPTNQWFYIQSATPSNPKDYAAYAKIWKKYFDVRWSGKDTIANDGSLMDELSKKPEYMWRLLPTDDPDSVYIQNFGTGLYLGPSAGLTEEPNSCAILPSYISGKFIIEIDSATYLNAEPTSNPSFDGDVVKWNSAGKRALDNSSWSFVPVELSLDVEPMIVPVTPQEIQPLVLPYEITGYDAIGLLYEIMGKKDGKLQLRFVDLDETVAAGTPLIYDLSEGTEDDVEEGFYATETLSNKALTINGIVGTYQSIFLPNVGAGYLEEGKIKVTNDVPVRITTYSFYLDANVPDITEDGDLALDIEGDLTNIKTAKIVNNKSIVDVYTLDGVLLRKSVKSSEATKGLPQGVYVVGNEKVVVK